MFLTFLTGLLFLANESVFFAQTLVKAKQARQSNLKVKVVLPTLASVQLKKGNSKTGRLTAIDSRSRKLKIEGGSSSYTFIPISEVSTVRFRSRSGSNPDNPIYRENRGLVVSFTSPVQPYYTPNSFFADTRTLPNQRYSLIWRQIPMTNFKLLDSKKGLAEVKLEPVINSQALQVVKNRTNNTYVLEEIKFENQGRMMLKLAMER
ncbi:MAG: hypothetical protein IGS39_01655 [Calothrix sp. C42_A2020_038]|nr:hypothetical protein [Calothrix sp. C42_A2020_038]